METNNDIVLQMAKDLLIKNRKMRKRRKRNLMRKSYGGDYMQTTLKIHHKKMTFRGVS